MMIDISQNRTIGEVQQDFNSYYPFLKLDFYKVQKFDETQVVRKQLDKSTLLKLAGIKGGGAIHVSEGMTVREIENVFFNDFGLVVQVSRRAGVMWLETSHTNNWTLAKQNEYGREISLTIKNSTKDKTEKRRYD